MSGEASKIVLVVPDGVGIRNFLCTSFLDHLLGPSDAGRQVLIWHALPEGAIAPHRRPEEPRLTWEPLPPWREGLAERVLRQAKIFAQLRGPERPDGSDVILLQYRRPRRLLDRLVQGAARLLGRLFPGPRGAARLDRWHGAAVGRNPRLAPYRSLLEDLRPDRVVTTHQRASRAVPALAAARRLGIPTGTFVYSWDNLPKGRMAVQADHYLVWSEAMAAELLRFYPEVDRSRVHVTGTPQLEPHTEAHRLEDRETFLRGLGLDPGRPVVCFSGDDVTTSPRDEAYLEDLARALTELPEPRPQLLFRRCPVDPGERYRPALERYPEIAVSEPRWRSWGADWSGVVPTPEDVDLLSNLVHHADLVVNLGSTMALDFAVVGKPAVWLAYDPPGVPPEWSVEDVYRLPHFAPVHRLGPVRWARSPEEIGPAVARALEAPEEGAEARRAWLEHTALAPLGGATRRIAEAIVRGMRQNGRERG